MSVPSTSSSRAEGSAASPRRPEVRGRSRFDDALARARGRTAAASDRGEPAAAIPPTASRTSARSPPRPGPDLHDRALEQVAAPMASFDRDPALGPPPGILELQAAIRAAPPAIAAAVRERQAHLALSFGGALAIDLRAGAQGLELSLRPAASLENAARAELPRLVEALRARGLRVAHAEVRAGLASKRPRERVDGPRGVR